MKIKTNIRAICFTNHGKHIIDKLNTADQWNIEPFVKCENADSFTGYTRLTEGLHEWAKEAFTRKDALVFVGAMGIAVRAIAECVKDKLTDSPVIVIDDNGQFVIPVLSGHVGGANELAIELAKALDAIPVVTSSTDNNDAFSVDLFARENGLAIVNRDKIKTVSAKAIEGKPVTLSIKNYPLVGQVDVVVSDENEHFGTIRLAPKKYVVGIGLKRGKAMEDLEVAMLKVLADNDIDINQVGALATIELKLDEDGLKALSKKYRMPLIGYDKELLAKVEGEFTSSQFVLDTVGVDNVCERAAVLATNQGELVVKKQGCDGVTIAIAKYR